MKISSRFSVSRQQFIDIAFLSAVSIAFLSLALYQIELPGIYGDELDKLVPTVALLNGQPFLWVGWQITAFGVRILLSFTDRIGPVLSYLPMPFILMFGYTPFAVRFSSIICALLTLIFAYYGAKRWFSPWTARFGIALTAVSPVFVFLQRMGYYNYGPVTLFTSLCCFFLARYLKDKNSRNLWAGAVFAGIAIETALQAVFVLIPMALIIILLFDDDRPRIREIVISLCIVLAVSAPVLLTAMKSGAMFSRIGWGGYDAGSLTLAGFTATLSEETGYFNEMLGGLDGVQANWLKQFINNIWMKYTFWLSTILLAFFFFLSQDRKDYLRRNAAPLLITLFGLFLTGFITNSNGHVSYQLIVLWPFSVLVVGAAFAQLYERFRRFRPITVTCVCALAILQAVVTIEAHQLLSQNRGRIETSAEIYPLARYLKERTELHPVAMEWGLLNQIYFLTGGERLPESIHGWWPKDGVPPPEFNAALSKQMKNPNNIYIFFAPGQGFDRYPHVERLAKSLGKTLSLEKVFYERNGSIAYRLYRVLNPDSVLRRASVSSNGWKVWYNSEVNKGDREGLCNAEIASFHSQ
jgi:hypothetical protein